MSNFIMWITSKRHFARKKKVKARETATNESGGPTLPGYEQSDVATLLTGTVTAPMLRHCPFHNSATLDARHATVIFVTIKVLLGCSVDVSPYLENLKCY
jgi:hypothetical protein